MGRKIKTQIKQHKKEKKIREKEAKKRKKRPSRFLVKFVGIKEKEYLIEMLAIQLSSGMDVIIGLEAIKKEVKTKVLKQIIDRIIYDIEVGTPFWKAFDASGLFPDHVVALIRIGEESGRLSQNFVIVSEQQKRERILRARVRAALTYPVFVIGLTLIIGLGISWFILPRFVVLFKSLKRDLPFLTNMLVKFGDFIMVYGYIFVPGTILLMLLLIYILFFNKKTKIMGQWLIFHLPISKTFIQEAELSSLGLILSTLLNAGLPVVQSLNSLANSTTYYNYKKFYKFVSERVQEGNSFLRSFGQYKNSDRLVPLSLQQMIGSGERSGNLADTLAKIGDTYEVKTEITAKNLTTILEPVLLIVIGLSVLFIALAIITPLYGFLNTLSR